MKICLINNLYKPYNRGGAEKVVESLAEGFLAKGDEVFIITTKPYFNKQKIKDRKYDLYYINGFYYNLNKLPKFLRLFWHLIDLFDLGSYWKVKKILRKENPDLAISNNLKGISYLIPFGIKELGIRNIHILHDIQLIHPSGLMIWGKEKEVDGFFSKLYYLLCRLLFSSVDLIVSPSQWLLDEHLKRGFFKNSKKMILPNPIEIAESKKRTTGNKTAEFKFLYVGQLEEHKGILFLIEAFKKINTPLIKEVEGFLKSELIIVGNGSKMREAKELARGNDKIKILGKKNKEEVANLMREANCLIVPSLCYENSPTVIYEALAAGLPIIASRIGGIPELLENNSGVVFEPNNSDDLINKIKQLINNYSEAEKNIRKSIERIKNNSADEYINKILK